MTHVIQRTGLMRGVLRLAAGGLLIMIVVVLFSSRVAGNEEPIASDVYSRLRDSRSELDVLPQLVASGTELAKVIDSDTIRFLGETNVSQHWIGQDKSGRICSVNEYIDPRGRAVFGSSCFDNAYASENGAMVSVATDLGGIRAFLIPDGFLSAESQEALASQGGHMPFENLALFEYQTYESLLASAVEILLTQGDGQEVTLSAPADPGAADFQP